MFNVHYTSVLKSMQLLSLMDYGVLFYKTTEKRNKLKKRKMTLRVKSDKDGKNNKEDSKIVKTNDTMNLVPKIGTTKKDLKFEFDDISIATVQYDEGPVGCTYIHFEKGATTYIDVRGGDPARIEYNSTMGKKWCSGICIAGGSIMGLEATVGVNAQIWKNNNYKLLKWGASNGSIIFSQNLTKNSIYPDKKLGEFAVTSLAKNVTYMGQVGAGASASFGQGCAFHEYKDGEFAGIKLFVMTVVNAIGDVYENDKLVKKSGYQIGGNNEADESTDKNTTITVLVTNLEMDDNELKQLARQVHTSMAETIRPFHTFYDGDVFYAASTQTFKKKIKLQKMIELFVKCSHITKGAILSSL